MRVKSMEIEMCRKTNEPSAGNFSVAMVLCGLYIWDHFGMMIRTALRGRLVSYL